MDVRLRTRFPLLWSTVREKELAKSICFFNMGVTNYPCVCRRTNLPKRGVHSEKVRETGSQMSQRRKIVTDN